MYLLAISGGPDSMFLLSEYKKSKIVVAHVNYNLRESSVRDKNLVESFCMENDIEFRTLEITNKPFGNTEAWARKIRYDFFEEIYAEFNCSKLLTGHHRDDFLETAIMQQESGRLPRFFGIKIKREINGMTVVRPFINLYWKSEIVAVLLKRNISYGIDETNNDEGMTRNRIRKDISTWPIKKKRSYVSWFKMSNRILKKKYNGVDRLYEKWANNGFDVKSFRSLPRYKTEIIFEFINNKFTDIKLSKRKLESIVSFVESSEGGKIFKLSDEHSLTKKSGTLIW